MPVIRPNALRGLQNALRYSGARATARTARTQLVAKRFASSGGGSHGEPSSDLPWLLSALAITPPACYYLWPDTTHAEHHGEHGDHEEHGEEEEAGKDAEEESQENSAPAEQAEEAEDKPDEKEEKSDEGSEEKSEEKSDDKSDDKSEEKSDDSGSKDTSDEQEEAKEDADTAKPSGSEGESQPKNLTNDKPSSGAEDSQPKEGGGKVEGVQFKGKMKSDSAGHNDTRKSEPQPGKGTMKKRIDSGLGQNLGEGTSSGDGDKMSNQQKGMSNTDTRHSSKIDEPGSEKSTKGSGGPETAKHKGTVDSTAPVK